MPRTSKLAKQIAYDILGVPVNMKDSEKYKTKRPTKVSQDMENAEQQDYYRK